MAIQFIEIGSDSKVGRPVIRLTETSVGSVWQYMGAHASSPKTGDVAYPAHDINRAAESAASALATKVSSRNVTVELQIDPLIPPMNIDIERVIPILTLIAENASASVEPGPGTVVLRTWCSDKLVGVDIVGRNGFVPREIRDNWTQPGFSTRVADWDTGFGLHAAIEAAEAIAAKIELFEPVSDVTFRLVIPYTTKEPYPSAEAEVGLSDLYTKNNGETHSPDDAPNYTLFGLLGGGNDVCEYGIIQA